MRADTQGWVLRVEGGAGEAATWWRELLGFKCARKHASPPPQPPPTENLSAHVALPATEGGRAREVAGAGGEPGRRSAGGGAVAEAQIGLLGQGPGSGLGRHFWR